MIELEIWHWQLIAVIATVGLISMLFFAVYVIKHEMKKFTREIVYGKSAEMMGLDPDELADLVDVFKYIRANEKDAIKRFVRNLK